MNGWVSVEHELPKIGELVILFNGCTVAAGYLRDLQFYKKPERTGKWQFGLITTNAVTHWQSMPEGPNT